MIGRISAPVRLLLLTLGLLALTAVVVYLAATPAYRQPEPVTNKADSKAFQPVSTPPPVISSGARVGVPAPVFSAPRFDNGTLSLADLRGKGVVMNFFASWCTPCRAEARDLEAVYRKHRDRGVVFLGVNIEQDTWDDARGFLREFGITYPAVRDERAEIAAKYQLYGLPTTFFIDRNGVIRSKFAGAFLGAEGLRELERRIEMIVP